MADKQDNNDKHIAVRSETKDRFAKFIPKKMYWDVYVNKVTDFLEQNKDKFTAYLEK